MYSCVSDADRTLISLSKQWQPTQNTEADFEKVNVSFNGTPQTAIKNIPLLQGLVAAQPEDYQAWTLLSWALIRSPSITSKQIHLAKTITTALQERLSTKDPWYPRVVAVQALLLKSDKKIAQARSLAEEAITMLRSEDSWVDLAMAQTCLGFDNEQAQIHSKPWLADPHFGPWSKRIYAEALLRLGEVSGAVDVLKKRNTHDAYLSDMLAKIYLYSGLPDKAVMQWNQSARVSPYHKIYAARTYGRTNLDAQEAFRMLKILYSNEALSNDVRALALAEAIYIHSDFLPPKPIRTILELVDALLANTDENDIAWIYLNYAKAVGLLRINQTAQAAPLLNKIAIKLPEEPALSIMAGMAGPVPNDLLVNIQRLTEEKVPDSDGLCYVNAYQQYLAKQLPSSVETLKKCYNIHPKIYRSRTIMDTFYVPRYAYAYLSKVTQKKAKTGNLVPLVVSGFASFQAGKGAVAQKVLKKVSKEVRKEVGPLILQGVSLMKKKKGKLSLKLFKQALQLDPLNTVAQLEMIRTISQGKRPKPGTLARAQKFVEANPFTIHARLLLAEILLKLKKEEQSLTELKKVIDLNPYEPGALRLLRKIKKSKLD